MADQKSKTSWWAQQAGGDGQNIFKAFDGSEGNYVGRVRRKSFGAAGKYIDVRQCKGTDYLAQESGLLVIGLDESHAQL